MGSICGSFRSDTTTGTPKPRVANNTRVLTNDKKLMTASGLSAGADAERTLLIVDPGNPESLYVANYYQAARGSLTLLPISSEFDGDFREL